MDCAQGCLACMQVFLRTSGVITHTPAAWLRGLLSWDLSNPLLSVVLSSPGGCLFIVLLVWGLTHL